eukprot:697477-Rhodomonas_salina.1
MVVPGPAPPPRRFLLVPSDPSRSCPRCDPKSQTVTCSARFGRTHTDCSSSHPCSSQLCSDPDLSRPAERARVRCGRE